MKTYRKGAKGALLDEYERAILNLQEIISTIPDYHLTKLVDTQTKDEDCRSVQSILSHIVRSGYAYAIYIHNHKGHEKTVPERVFHSTVSLYVEDLRKMFTFTDKVFQAIEESELEQSDNFRKIHVSWNQLYDIEQLMEHAIVHILRHRRQIEKFKILLATKTS